MSLTPNVRPKLAAKAVPRPRDSKLHDGRIENLSSFDLEPKPPLMEREIST